MDRYYILFSELNERLQKENISLSIVCAGGYVLNYYDIRTTKDVDGFFQETSTIKSIIKEIGDKNNINENDELWLNNSIQNMNKCPPKKICKIVYNFSNLKILIPPLEYIAGMKLESGREQDIDDVTSIIKKMKIDTPNSLKKLLHRYGFEHVDESLLLESFGRAYGMQWMVKYYQSNEQYIADSIEQNETPKESSSFQEVMKIPSKRRKEYEKTGISLDDLMSLVADGWKAEDLAHGYIAVDTGSGTEIDLPHTVQIQTIDRLGFYKSDDEARKQAAIDGVKFINDMSELEKGVYVDTPKNREACATCLQKHPEYRIENVLPKLDKDYRKKYIAAYGNPGETPPDGYGGR